MTEETKISECKGIHTTCANCASDNVFIDAEKDIMFCEDCGEWEQVYYKSSEDTKLKRYD